jgi:GTP-binding protein Era
MNRFVGEKVAIVSDRPQTTRTKILGVATGEDWQIVFVDTPGLHKPRTKLGEYMIKAAQEAREGVDAVLCVVDATHVGAGTSPCFQDVGRMAARSSSPSTRSTSPPLKPCCRSSTSSRHPLRPDRAGVRPPRRRHGRALAPHPRRDAGGAPVLPGGHDHRPAGARDFAEIIREKALINLREEIPHGVGVEMLSIEEGPALTEIHANLYCERESHKAIIIGKHGQMLAGLAPRRGWTSSAS